MKTKRKKTRKKAEACCLNRMIGIWLLFAFVFVIFSVGVSAVSVSPTSISVNLSAGDETTVPVNITIDKIPTTIELLTDSPQCLFNNSSHTTLTLKQKTMTINLTVWARADWGLTTYKCKVNFYFPEGTGGGGGGYVPPRQPRQPTNQNQTTPQNQTEPSQPKPPTTQEQQPPPQPETPPTPEQPNYLSWILIGLIVLAIIGIYLHYKLKNLKGGKEENE